MVIAIIDIFIDILITILVTILVVIVADLIGNFILIEGKKIISKTAIWRFYKIQDGVGFFLVENFHQLSEVLINGGFLSAEEAKEFLCGNVIAFATGFTFTIKGKNFMFIPTEIRRSVYASSMIRHELCHIKNRHVERIMNGDYDGLQTEVICGQLVVYNFEAQADAYALKKSGHLFYESKESMLLFEELYKKCSLDILNDLEALYDLDLSSYKDSYRDDDVIDIITTSLKKQIDMRKKLLPKYL